MQANQYPCGSTPNIAALPWDGPIFTRFTLKFALLALVVFLIEQKFQWRFKYIGHFKIIQLEVERWGNQGNDGCDEKSCDSMVFRQPAQNLDLFGGQPYFFFCFAQGCCFGRCVRNFAAPPGKADLSCVIT